MFGEVIPVAQTEPSWNLFIKVIQQTTGTSPTRGLDTQNIQKGPAAFAQCIDLKNNPHGALRDYNEHLSHISITFLVAGDEEFSRSIGMMREMLVTSPSFGMYFVTSSLDDWNYSIRRILAKSIPKAYEKQRFFSVVFGIFRAIGYKDLWNDCVQVDGGNDIILLQ